MDCVSYYSRISSNDPEASGVFEWTIREVEWYLSKIELATKYQLNARKVNVDIK